MQWKQYSCSIVPNRLWILSLSRSLSLACYRSHVGAMWLKKDFRWLYNGRKWNRTTPTESTLRQKKYWWLLFLGKNRKKLGKFSSGVNSGTEAKPRADTGQPSIWPWKKSLRHQLIWKKQKSYHFQNNINEKNLLDCFQYISYNLMNGIYIGEKRYIRIYSGKEK